MATSTLGRVGVTTAVALAGLGVFAVAPAQAQSAELDYTCSLLTLDGDIDPDQLPEEARKALELAQEGDLSGIEGLDAIEGLQDALPLEEIGNLAVTAVFDSAIADDATTPVGSTVKLSPLKATVTLLPETVAALTGIDIESALAGAVLYAGIDETGKDREAFFEFDDIALDDGRLNLSGTGDAQSFKVRETGTHTYVAGDLEIFLADSESTFTMLECTLDEDQDATIDQITAQAAPTTTPPPATTAPTPTPVRPSVVQTDAAQPTSPTWLPLAAVATGSILVLGAGSHLLRRRALRD